MRSYLQSFAAGESKDFLVDAKYFFLFEANDPVTIQMWKNGAPSDDLALNVLAGFKVRPKNGFDRLTITSGTTQSVRFFIATGEGDYDRALGSVSITNLQLDNGRIQVAPVAYSASYASGSNLTAGVSEVVVLPAANVNGILLWNAQFVSYNATALARTSLIAKITAPATVIDGEVILSPQNLVFAAGVFGVMANLVTPVKISAGKGLYFHTGTTETFGSRSLLYTLL